MTRERAIETAQEKFKDFMAFGEHGHRGNSRAFGFVWRSRDGRWDIYSIDIAQWHITLSDNGAHVVHAIDCSNL